MHRHKTLSWRWMGRRLAPAQGAYWRWWWRCACTGTRRSVSAVGGVGASRAGGRRVGGGRSCTLGSQDARRVLVERRLAPAQGWSASGRWWTDSALHKTPGGAGGEGLAPAPRRQRAVLAGVLYTVETSVPVVEMRLHRHKTLGRRWWEGPAPAQRWSALVWWWTVSAPAQDARRVLDGDAYCTGTRPQRAALCQARSRARPAGPRVPPRASSSLRASRWRSGQTAQNR
ncbi:MAG: hypothetical protein MZW92_36275 [Comamonadaceae bacterium]|nr:hypothetical protein [Comamonadaceae bacterium]